MSVIQIEATLKDSDRVATAEYDFGDNLQQAVEMFGEEVVFTRFRAAAVIDAQALMRRKIKKGDSDDAIKAAVAQWKPTVAAVGVGAKKPSADFLAAKAKSLTAEEKAALLAQLKAQLGVE